jgi:hypothetical protein
MGMPVGSDVPRLLIAALKGWKTTIEKYQVLRDAIERVLP